MKITDRYIAKEFIKPFFISLFIFIFLYLLVQFLGELGDALKEKQKLYLLFKNYLMRIPSVFVQLSPIAILISFLLVLGGFSRYNEIVAFGTSGISLHRILLPFLVFGFILSGISFFVNDRIVPPLSLKIEKSEEKVSNLTFRTKEKMLYARLFDKKKGAFFDLQILSYENRTLKRSLNAKESFYLHNETWILKDGISRNFDGEDNCISQNKFDSLKINLGINPETLLIGYRKSEQLSFSQLLSYLRKLRSDGIYPAVQLVDLHAKIAFPLINLIILFLGLPLFFSSHLPTNKPFGIGFSILACILYYWIFSLGIALGKEGLLYPFLGAWFANFFFGAIGLFFLASMRR
ncbi:MAG: hypothetical protein COZ37_01585 [bacterium (Candidatus Ratteibacteria) CG_4_10_14_3_um_filter_41_18]|uniref:LPS export ABC transporter permease LptG n=2 Tax=Candidatus Ratteibacteria TaxID=2979319 RepID=A0A2M7YEE2_9BACT|nr:MAG: hypothetical protein AUJ76_00550 [Candidatus Omnitrophica bacterium CG1_02_41_171]PIW74072.1 MAG: hypothetical protein CO004_02645 [bacterium (Candidatus Ratteibacteria) CG_4_8_14_3_um_filter_41_36]PIX77650.1 MAG: hypothetical protein COZ37_01585 [bacterium (Candidatus Ratteibacteria) CG_4_10_14_3_um_filter_41_18]PJA61352.1 MAG: hypothetical protein CO162_06790 [bacterium (Candidatus Ratteibacteria) CG_4_9_14_3_um_filter_41_21]HCG77078.1 hypothetical protein [bacterium]